MFDEIASSYDLANRVMSCGIDISLAFQRFYGIELPIFIDDYELFSKNNRPTIAGQEVRFIVDDSPFNIINQN